MVWPTDSLERKLSEIDTVMLRVKEYSQRRKADMSSGPVSSGVIIDLRTQMIQAKDKLTELQGVSGLHDYARTEKGNAQLDVATEFSAVKSEIDKVVSNIESSFPADGDGYLLATKFTASGIEDRQFLSAETSQLRDLLDAVIATID